MFGTLLWRILMAPFALLYGGGVSLRNFLYQRKVLKSVSFNYPVIGIGNLSVGGSGKTPHTEFILRLLQQHVKVGVLSRGYKRKSGGYRDVNVRDNVVNVGDEPLQIKRKYSTTAVAVCENRALGIPKLLQQNPDVRVVLLDDIFQHRAVSPGLNILLTTHSDPFWKDYILPAGRLREWRSGYKRADAMIISKCPNEMDKSEAEQIKSKFKDSGKPVFFSTLNYGKPYFLFDGSVRAELAEDMDVVLFAGIANADPLKSYLEDRVNSVFSVEFGDHHHFTKFDVAQLYKVYSNLDSDKKLIITTEKDAVRLDEHLKYINNQRMPIFVLPVQVSFLFDGKETFEDYVKQFLLDFKV